MESLIGVSVIVRGRLVFDQTEVCAVCSIRTYVSFTRPKPQIRWVGYYFISSLVHQSVSKSRNREPSGCGDSNIGRRPRCCLLDVGYCFLGMATAFAESLLAQVYKVRDTNGEFRGGPAYYIQRGVGSKVLATLFSISLMFGYTLVFNATQANTIADALNHSYQIPELWTGAVIIVLAGLIFIGGLKSIARFSEIVVPIMAMTFVVTVLFITLINISQVPSLLAEIVLSAFGLKEAAGATFAVAVQNGIKRGLYSNEAGAGSVPQAAAAASPNPNHPATQGYIQMLGVFIDTIVICTCTALVIMLGGDYLGVEITGITMTQDAMSAHLGSAGGHFVAILITLFAFTSIVGNYAYAESNLHFFHLDTRMGRLVFYPNLLSNDVAGNPVGVEAGMGYAGYGFRFYGGD